MREGEVMRRAGNEAGKKWQIAWSELERSDAAGLMRTQRMHTRTNDEKQLLGEDHVVGAGLGDERCIGAAKGGSCSVAATVCE